MSHDVTPNEGEMVIGSGRMAALISRLGKVAGLDTTVLLSGESGTGKEIVARWLHANHPLRRTGPMVCVHCGAIPETLLESELFGHVRGAFSGAERDRVGVFEQADGGTLLLDEISTMTPQAQVRLLRALQERRVTRLGSTRSRPVDVRVVVASNRNLKQMVDEGTFRLDLYYRINGFPAELPPLRRRGDDIALLAELFGRRAMKRMGLDAPKRIRPEALNALNGYAWPGNVRELENAIEHAYILSDDRDEIELRDFPGDIAGAAAGDPHTDGRVQLTEKGLSFRTAVTNLERDLILQSLRLSGGNKARAAALLDLKRTTFLEKLHRLEADGVLQTVAGT